MKHYINYDCGLDVLYDVTYVVKPDTFASVELYDTCTRRTLQNMYATYFFMTHRSVNEFNDM